MRHAVVVLVEAYVRRLADAHREGLLDRKVVSGKPDHLRALVQERRLTRGLSRVGHLALLGDLQAPRTCLLVEIGERLEFARREKVLASVADRAFHASFFVRPVRRAGPRLEAVVSRKREQRRVEAHRISLAFEHGALEVVVQDRPWCGAEEAKRFDVAGEKARHRRAHGETQKAQAAVRQHDHEGPKSAERATDRDRAEVRPVDLRLLPRQHHPTQVRLGCAAGPQPTYNRPEATLRAGVTTRLRHGPEPARAKPRVLVELLLEKVDVGIHKPRPRRLLVHVEP